ncbi:MAG: Tol-Pal system beta propeller repeat protein TolB [Lactobacillaceae bacterium]|jgi:TolB protein|nr:Tol-Pal system beta propeller repeat protein TolB [Lactobacillaceae bacterium]
MKIKYFVAFLICLFPGIGRAELQIDVVGAMSNPLPLAFPDVLSEGSTRRIASDIKDVISADLQNTGLFRIIPESSYIQKFKTINDQPVFVDWKAINSHALIQSAIVQTDPDTVRIDVRIWDAPAEKQLFAQAFSSKKSNWRRTAHKIADKIYERLTGEKGYFDTRIVYISESGPATQRVKRLAIMDQDGENHKFLTSGNAMALTPRFSPNMQKITYLSYAGSVPKVYILNINTGRQDLVGHFPGMTFAPAFSPDSGKLVFSYAANGNSEIYEMDLETKQTKQLTNHPAIDTSPSYSPDGRKIVFNSDRGGNQQLYVMGADGGNAERISFGNGRYATPAWSPRGDYIAFTKMANGQFYIGVMYPDGSGERVIASGYLVEAPVWSPNGRVLMFFRQERGGKFRNAAVNLYSIDITGYNERKIVTPAEASDPAWSPLLD